MILSITEDTVPQPMLCRLCGRLVMTVHSPKYLICYLLVGFIQKFYSIIGIGAVLRIDQPFTNGFYQNRSVAQIRMEPK